MRPGRTLAGLIVVQAGDAAAFLTFAAIARVGALLLIVLTPETRPADARLPAPEIATLAA